MMSHWTFDRAPWMGPLTTAPGLPAEIIFDETEEMVVEVTHEKHAGYALRALNEYDELRDVLSASRAALIHHDKPEVREQAIRRISEILGRHP